MDKKLFFPSLLLVLGLGLSITSFWEAWDTHSSSPGSHVEPAVVGGGGRSGCDYNNGPSASSGLEEMALDVPGLGCKC